ncbi:hypothetical protein N7451_010999 [Penicillium sp. IBT 35674x]|nr:hypothetical protein N7451_010999 [Penicillium sp. IBT 35674x]
MTSAAVQISGGHGPLLADKPTVPFFEKPHHVQTTLNFFKENEDGSPPLPNYVNKPETYEREAAVLPTTIHDISGHELDYTLDGQGFQFYYHESKEKDFLDDEKLKREYYPETEQLLKDAVFIFDHTIRRGSGRTKARGPVQRVHIDQSYQAAENRVSYHLPEDAAELSKGRYQIINVWRPIRTIFKIHLLSQMPTLIYPDREGETYAVKPDPDIKWYYRYGQTPDLVTLIKCFDSKTDGRARRVPHSAFVNPDTENEAGRESIEVRALVFHPDDRG